MDVAAVSPIPAVPVIENPPLVIRKWNRSPDTAERPDPNEQTGERDMTVGKTPVWVPGCRHFAVSGSPFIAQRSRRAAVQKSGGQVKLRDVLGKAQVWIDGELAGEKKDIENRDLTVACDAASGQRTISVLVEAAAPDAPAGLGGDVAVE